MMLEEARAVGEIVSHADGGCQACVSCLVSALQKRFPEFNWLVPEDYAEWRPELVTWAVHERIDGVATVEMPAGLGETAKYR